jgi:hypothetical protein
MRYIIFVIDNRTHSGTTQEMAAIDVFNEKLQTDGHWVMAAGIGSPDAAKLIDKSTSTSGSLFNSPEFYSGFWVIEAEDETLAIQLATQGSKACNRKVELRPFLV